MKKGYVKILIFEILLFLFLLLNSFIKNILNRFTILILLMCLILIFKKLFGVEKERKRYIKDIMLEIIIIYLLSFILYYLLGMITSFYRTENYLTMYGICQLILPAIIFVIFKEYFRQLIITKSENSKLLYCATVVLFILLDLTNIIPYETLTTNEGIFEFVSIYLLPAISNNVVASYIATKSNYKINILWMLISQLYLYILPIIPNVGDYILSVIRMIFPFVIFGRLKNFFDKEKDDYLIREYNKKQVLPIIVASLIIVIIVYFTSGYFKYYAVAIASGSMKPKIYKGDVVVIKKIDEQYEKIKEGQILAYNHQNAIVVHRIVKIIKEDDKYYFYTKGDANEEFDQYAIYEEDIIGLVNFKIPYIGYPTVWLSEI